MPSPKIHQTIDGRYIAWIQCVAESDICDTREAALVDLCKVLANMLDSIKKIS